MANHALVYIQKIVPKGNWISGLWKPLKTLHKIKNIQQNIHTPAKECAQQL